MYLHGSWGREAATGRGTVFATRELLKASGHKEGIPGKSFVIQVPLASGASYMSGSRGFGQGLGLSFNVFRDCLSFRHVRANGYPQSLVRRAHGMVPGFRAHVRPEYVTSSVYGVQGVGQGLGLVFKKVKLLLIRRESHFDRAGIGV